MELFSSDTKNTILAALSVDDFGLLKRHLTFVDLPVRRQLEKRNQAVDYVYFLESGLASVVISAGANQNIEIGIIGFEGMTGLSILHESDRALYETFIQSAGEGWRIPSGDLLDAIRSSPSLRTVLMHYAHTVTTQMAFTALSNGRFKVEERLARWLLMARDRSSSDTIALTHEFLAIMLGVRRPGVTNALNSLGRRKLIVSQRGNVTIIDRAGMEEAANGCYGGAENEYRRLFGKAFSKQA